SVSHSHPMSPLRWNVGTTPSSSIPAKSHSLRERFQVGVLRNVRSEIAHANRNPHRQPSSALAAAARPTGQCAQHSRVHINQALASRNKSSFNPLRSDLPFHKSPFVLCADHTWRAKLFLSEQRCGGRRQTDAPVVSLTRCFENDRRLTLK